MHNCRHQPWLCSINYICACTHTDYCSSAQHHGLTAMLHLPHMHVMCWHLQNCSLWLLSMTATYIHTCTIVGPHSEAHANNALGHYTCTCCTCITVCSSICASLCQHAFMPVCMCMYVHAFFMTNNFLQTITEMVQPLLA